MIATDKQAYSSHPYRIRQCTIEDEESALSVCLKTGDSGSDGSLFFNDPNVLGYRYVSPYIHYSPELAFVLEDTEGHVCGYVLAVLQSDLFYKRYVDEWLPKMKQLYPSIPLGEEERSKRDWQVIEGFHHDDLQSFKLFDDYPSHLHIDLLPKAQGQGYGTKMIHHIVSELQRRGSKGVHLGQKSLVSTFNSNEIKTNLASSFSTKVKTHFGWARNGHETFHLRSDYFSNSTWLPNFHRF